MGRLTKLGEQRREGKPVPSARNHGMVRSRRVDPLDHGHSPGEEAPVPGSRHDAKWTTLNDLAHDLRNPLSVILLCSEQLSKRLIAEAPSPHLRRVETIARAAEEIRLLLERLGGEDPGRNDSGGTSP